MADNKALLSQEEIDILLEFLLERKSEVGMEVMDQESIDKLIALLRTGGERRLRFDTDVPEVKDDTAIPLMIIEESREAQNECLLECEVTASGFVAVYCANQMTGRRFRITPACIERMYYTAEDRSEWGMMIPPVMFDKIAALLKIKYTKKTFDEVCQRYVDIVYGKGSMQHIPAIFMPTAYQLIQHLTD
ncbi:MAG: hypothetical protein IJY09_04810 [Lachnospiraceae bacterium]|nr:hypothetical protein [Lachnospiraceae bacterium]